MAEWKLVPCEPSEAMAYAACLPRAGGEAYKTALAATPPLPLSEWEQMVERAARAAVFKPGVLDIERMARALRAALPGLVIEGEQEDGR